MRPPVHTPATNHPEIDRPARFEDATVRKNVEVGAGAPEVAASEFA
jgi:hypothetical protein